MNKLNYTEAAVILGLQTDSPFAPEEERMIAACVNTWIANYGEDFVREYREVFLCNFANMGILRLSPGMCPPVS